MSSLSTDSNLTDDSRRRLLGSVNPKSLFYRLDNGIAERVENTTLMSNTGLLTLTLIGFLETEDYVLEFSNN